MMMETLKTRRRRNAILYKRAEIFYCAKIEKLRVIFGLTGRQTDGLW